MDEWKERQTSTCDVIPDVIPESVLDIKGWIKGLNKPD